MEVYQIQTLHANSTQVYAQAPIKMASMQFTWFLLLGRGFGKSLYTYLLGMASCTR